MEMNELTKISTHCIFTNSLSYCVTEAASAKTESSTKKYRADLVDNETKNGSIYVALQTNVNVAPCG